ncbi:atp-dependent nuclease, subunit b [hydrocarbon metagenome]|uniref:Atp-dependent nuclease, subunit b n=1 Tax=hydrocarbon metagenome TaxID=938273 RepID=A0A0W8FKH3_9ZZZZ
MPIAAGAVDPASTPEPLAIPLDEDGSETILLRGRIDRVDVSPDGAFMVTDYKTGSVQTRLKDIMEGKALQLPLYLRAVELLTGLQGAAGAYYTVRRGDIRCRPIFWDQGRRDHFAPFRVAKSSGVEDIGALIDASLARAKAYLDDIRRGRFPPRRDAGPCPSYCGYRTVCRFDPLRLAALDGEVPDGAD